MHPVKLLSPGPHVQAAKPQLTLPTGHGSEAATLSLLTGESLGLPRSLPPSPCISLTLSYTRLWLETAEEGSVLPAGGADPASCGTSRCSPPAPGEPWLKQVGPRSRAGSPGKTWPWGAGGQMGPYSATWLGHDGGVGKEKRPQVRREG